MHFSTEQLSLYRVQVGIKTRFYTNHQAPPSSVGEGNIEKKVYMVWAEQLNSNNELVRILLDGNIVKAFLNEFSF